MGKPYSVDLRERVVSAVETGGLSCNRAAKQFGVGISTAINWVKRLRETGSCAGQDGRSQAEGDFGRAPPMVIAADFTLRGLVAKLAERGLKVDYRSFWEFVHAEKLSFKKTWWLANPTVPTSRGGDSGQSIKVVSSLSVWSSALFLLGLQKAGVKFAAATCRRQTRWWSAHGPGRAPHDLGAHEGGTRCRQGAGGQVVRLATALMSLCSEDGRLCQCRGFPCIAPLPPAPLSRALTFRIRVPLGQDCGGVLLIVLPPGLNRAFAHCSRPLMSGSERRLRPPVANWSQLLQDPRC
jgi:transposase